MQRLRIGYTFGFTCDKNPSRHLIERNSYFANLIHVAAAILMRCAVWGAPHVSKQQPYQPHLTTMRLQRALRQQGLGGELAHPRQRRRCSNSLQHKHVIGRGVHYEQLLSWPLRLPFSHRKQPFPIPLTFTQNPSLHARIHADNCLIRLPSYG